MKKIQNLKFYETASKFWYLSLLRGRQREMVTIFIWFGRLFPLVFYNNNNLISDTLSFCVDHSQAETNTGIEKKNSKNHLFLSFVSFFSNSGANKCKQQQQKCRRRRNEDTNNIWVCRPEKLITIKIVQLYIIIIVLYFGLCVRFDSICHLFMNRLSQSTRIVCFCHWSNLSNRQRCTVHTGDHFIHRIDSFIEWNAFSQYMNFRV